MTETHVTNDTVTPERVTNEGVVTPPKRDRAAYMRDYRARQSDKSDMPEIKSETPQHDPELIKPEAPIPVETKTAEQYHEQISQADEAAIALRRQIGELRKSEELNRQRQQQAAEANQQLNKLFQFWQASGLSPREEQALRSNPELMVRLTDYAMQQATGHGHVVGTAEHTDATKKLFREHLAHLHDQAMASQQSTEPTGNGHAEAETMTETPRFFQPPPPRPAPQPAPHYSAPVSRTVPNGGPRPDFETDERRIHLSVDEKAIAKASGISEVEYARNKIKLQGMKARGEIV